MTGSLSGLPLPRKRILPFGRAGRSGRPATILMTVDAVGGVWRYAMDLARGLQGELAFVFVGLGPRPSREQATEAQRLGTLVWTDEPLDWMVEDEADLAGVTHAIEHLAREHRADLVHLNLPSQAAGIAVDVPVIVVSHSCVVSWWRAVRAGPLPHGWTWQRRYNRRGFDRADMVVVPSQAHADLLGRCYGDLPQVTVVHNGIEPVAVRPHKSRFVFAAGRWWDEGKNAAVLDKAAAHLKWPVIAVGPLVGPQGQQAEVRHATSVGPRPHRDVLDLVGRAAIAVSPSIYEPFGLVAAEAASAGAALVLSDIPTYRELWDGVAQFVDPHRPDDLAATLGRLIDDPSLRTALGQKARDRSNRYSSARQATAMCAIYGVLCPGAVRPIAAGI